MAKDPAVLLYTSDFLTGTFTMNYEQRGKYITLLCLQHQQGFLTEEDLKNVLEDTDVKIFSKFEKLADGYYYNIRLKNESERRKNYSESRRQNRMKNLSKSYVKHMETGTGTEIENNNLKLVNKTITGNITKIERENNLADVLTGSLEQVLRDRDSKAIVEKFDDLFSDV